MAEKAILTVGDRKYELPLLTGTEGERALDITKLRDQTGLVAYDPSLGNTAVCRSAITFTDGENGILHYRGIPIEQFVTKPNFVEVAWLLIFGRLPRADELKRFSSRLTANELLHEGMKHQYQHIPLNAPPMAILSATLSNLACYHQEFFALETDESLEEAAAQADQQGPHHRRVLLPPLDGAAVHLPRPEPPLLRQFPAHDVLDPVQPVHRDAGDRGRPEPDLHPPRRPRAEL